MIGTSYNASSTAAVRALQSTSRDLIETQTRIATGKKINNSSDNAAIYALASKVGSDINQSSAYQQNLKLASANAQVATAAVDSVTNVLNNIRAKVSSYSAADTAGKAALMKDITSLQGQLKSIGNQSSLDGANNLLNGSNTSVTVGISATDSDVLDLADTDLFSAAGVLVANRTASSKGITTFVAADLDTDLKITNLMTDIGSAITDTAKAASAIGSAAKRYDSAASFLTTLNDIKTKAISSLVDADLDEESARLTALQTNQSLQATILQIANQSSQNILRLFQ